MIDDPDANLGAPCDETPGRVGQAPCGHRGLALIGTFVRCTEGCADDSKPPAPARAPTQPDREGMLCPHCYPVERVLSDFPQHPATGVERGVCLTCRRVFEIVPCPRCKSDDVDAFGGDDWHCWDCGHCFKAV